MSADSDTPTQPGWCPSCGGPVVPALACRGVARYACVPCSAKPDGPAHYIAAELDTSPNTPEPAPVASRISALTREQIAAAEKACAEGKCERVGEGCVAGHVAADVLAAYDAVGPAVVEVMREMLARKRTLMLAYEVTANPMHARFLDGGASRLTWALEELRKALDLPCDWDQS